MIRTYADYLEFCASTDTEPISFDEWARDEDEARAEYYDNLREIDDAQY